MQREYTRGAPELRNKNWLNSNLTCGTSIWGRSLLIRQIFIKRRVIFNANRLTKALNELYATRPDPGFFVYNFCAIMHHMTTAFFSVDLTAPDALTRIFTRKQVADDYQVVTMAHGLCTMAGTRMYTCMQHDDEALKKTLKIWEYLLSLIPRI